MEMKPFSPVDEFLKITGIGFCMYLVYRVGVKVGMTKQQTPVVYAEYWEDDEENDE